MKYLETSNSFGHNQFAYRKNKGYRDALAFNVCSWLMAFNLKMQVALYCSDVSGAFDRVCRHRLSKKLNNVGLHCQLLKVFEAWLTKRIAYVVVHGVKSSPIELLDMIFQGSVLGPTCGIYFMPIVFDQSINTNSLKVFSRTT